MRLVSRRLRRQVTLAEFEQLVVDKRFRRLDFAAVIVALVASTFVLWEILR